MEPYHWVVLVALIPPVEGLYYSALIFGGGWVGYEYRAEHQFLLHIPFIYAAAVAVVLLFPVSLPLGVSAVALVAPLVGVALYYLHTLVWTGATGSQMHWGGQSLAYAVPTVVSAPAEEVLFRGVLLPVADDWGPVAFVGLSALIFGLAHLIHRPREAAFKTVNGAVYAVLLLVTGSILVPVLAHVGHNLAYVRVATGASPDPTA
jgi:membrane protease YdiL (CAAX protease family)